MQKFPIHKFKIVRIKDKEERKMNRQKNNDAVDSLLLYVLQLVNYVQRASQKKHKILTLFFIILVRNIHYLKEVKQMPTFYFYFQFVSYRLQYIFTFVYGHMHTYVN